MDLLKKVIVGTLSLAPLVGLILVAVLEPLLYGTGLDRKTVRESADVISLISGVLMVVMIVFFASYTHRSSDPRLKDKKSLWIWILILGNIFAIPVFWYLFFRSRDSAIVQQDRNK